MVRDILDLHSVSGQGVRSSEEFPGAAAHRLSVSLPKLASLPVNLLVEGLSNLPVRNFVQDIRTSVLALLLVFASQSRARMRKPRNYIVFAGDTTVRLTCVMPCNHCRVPWLPWVAFVFCQVKAAASSRFQMWTSVVGIASP